jgi:hypothetical protein
MRMQGHSSSKPLDVALRRPLQMDARFLHASNMLHATYGQVCVE